jgi:hypothetical protein
VIVRRGFEPHKVIAIGSTTKKALERKVSKVRACQECTVQRVLSNIFAKDVKGKNVRHGPLIFWLTVLTEGLTAVAQMCWNKSV